MKNSCTIFLILVASVGFAQSDKLETLKSSNKDWLVSPFEQKATITKEGKNIILNNGLVKRTFVIAPNVACFDYTNLTNGQQLIRSVEPEAKVVIDQITYKVGGLSGQKEKAYLQMDGIKNLQKADSDFIYTKYTISKIDPFINWKPTTWLGNAKQPTGARIDFEYASTLPALKNIIIKVHYELYDGIPLITKWISIQNNSNKSIKINRVVNEVLG